MFEALSAEMKALFTSEVKKVHEDVKDLRAEVLDLPESMEGRLVGAFKESLDMTKNELAALFEKYATAVDTKISGMQAQIDAKDSTIKTMEAAASTSTEDADMAGVGDVVQKAIDKLNPADTASTSAAGAVGTVGAMDPDAKSGTGFDSLLGASTKSAAEMPAATMAQMPASTLVASGGITDENPGLTASAVANTTK